MEDAEVGEFVEGVRTIERALDQLVREEGRNPAVLYGSMIEPAASRIMSGLMEPSASQRHFQLILPGLRAVARLHYARYHSCPTKPPAFLWSAVRLFSMFRAIQNDSATIPEDIATILAVLSAEDPLSADGIDGPITAIDTASWLAQYAGVAADLDALRRAETLATWAVGKLPSADPVSAIGLHTLLGVLVKRWELGDADVTSQTLQIVNLVTDQRYRDHPQRPHLLASAGGALYVAAARAKSPAYLDRSIDLLDQAVKALGSERLEPGYLQNLGRAELLRWAWTEGAECLKTAIGNLRAAVENGVPDTALLAESRAWLSMALLSGDRPEPVDAARHLDATLADLEIPGRGVDRDLLVQVLLMLWRVGSRDDAVLDTAIEFMIEVERSSTPRTLKEHQYDLVNALWDRWDRKRDIADIDEVIRRLAPRAELESTPPLVLNLLARSLRARWELTGDSVAIRHSIRCLTRAIARSDQHDPATAMYVHNLGTMWLRLYEANGEEECLNEAVRNIASALAHPANNADRSMFADSGSLAALQRWKLKSGDADLDESVRLARISAALTPDDHPDGAAHLFNQGNVFLQAAVHLEDSQLLKESINSLHSAIGLAGAKHSGYGGMMLILGEALLMQGKMKGDAGEEERGRNLIRRSIEHRFIRPVDAIQASRRWGEEAAALRDWHAAAAAMRDAVARLADLPGHRLEWSDHERLLVNLKGLATDAAASCLNDGGANKSAIECLEAARGVLLAKALRQDDDIARLEQQNEPVARRVRQVQALLIAD